MQEPVDRRAQRASDADRERVAEVLRQAAGDGRLSLDELEERLEATYGARTYGELEPVIRDLPAVPGEAQSNLPRPVPQRTPARTGGTPSSTAAVAVFSGADRKGVWVVPRSFTALAIFGGVDLDLREARFEAPEVTITASALFGGIDIIVPEDVQVFVSGAGIFGGFGHPSDPAAELSPDAPIIRINGVAIFGGVDVKRRPRGEGRR